MKPNKTTLQWTIFVAITFLGCCALKVDKTIAQSPSLPQELTNGGFETKGKDEKPLGWFFVGQGGGTIKLDPVNPFSGETSAFLDSTQAANKGSGSFTNLIQSVDGKSKRGKRVRFRAAVRTAELSSSSRVQLWFRVDLEAKNGATQRSGSFDNMQDRPISTSDWKEFDIVLPINDDATAIVVGLFIMGPGKAWIDEASLEEVDADTPATSKNDLSSLSTAAANIPSGPLNKARAEAAQSPRQPFFNRWLWLALLGIVASVIGMIPLNVSDGESVWSSLALNLQGFAFRFTICYWGLYCLPSLAFFVPWLGIYIVQSYSSLTSIAVQWIAKNWFQMVDELVPPNGSGDTTYNYLAILAMFVLAFACASVWSILSRLIKRDYRNPIEVNLQQIGWTMLRLTIASAMLGYGLAKFSLEMNQFPANADFQLAKTWGNSSPMNVLWAFMGTSRGYTYFAGLGEILAAMLLPWRRTATLGAMVALGVMTNVMMLNFCYDVPVKIYSTHLVVASILVMVPDSLRLLNVLVLNRPTQAVELPSLWKTKPLFWIRIALKIYLIYVFAFPVAIRTWEMGQHFAKVLTSKEVDETETSPYMIRSRGFRWINEIPFNR